MTVDLPFYEGDPQVAADLGADRLTAAEEEGGACESCRGSGRMLYPTSRTWRMPIEGEEDVEEPSGSLTQGVCNVCWGSGSVRPWPSHAVLQLMTTVQLALRQMRGCGLKGCWMQARRNGVRHKSLRCSCPGGEDAALLGTLARMLDDLAERAELEPIEDF